MLIYINGSVCHVGAKWWYKEREKKKKMEMEQEGLIARGIDIYALFLDGSISLSNRNFLFKVFPSFSTLPAITAQPNFC